MTGESGGNETFINMDAITKVVENGSPIGDDTGVSSVKEQGENLDEKKKLQKIFLKGVLGLIEGVEAKSANNRFNEFKTEILGRGMTGKDVIENYAEAFNNNDEEKMSSAFINSFLFTKKFLERKTNNDNDKTHKNDDRQKFFKELGLNDEKKGEKRFDLLNEKVQVAISLSKKLNFNDLVSGIYTEKELSDAAEMLKILTAPPVAASEEGKSSSDVKSGTEAPIELESVEEKPNNVNEKGSGNGGGNETDNDVKKNNEPVNGDKETILELLRNPRFLKSPAFYLLDKDPRFHKIFKEIHKWTEKESVKKAGTDGLILLILFAGLMGELSEMIEKVAKGSMAG